MEGGRANEREKVTLAVRLKDNDQLVRGYYVWKGKVQKIAQKKCLQGWRRYNERMEEKRKVMSG